MMQSTTHPEACKQKEEHKRFCLVLDLLGCSSRRRLAKELIDAADARREGLFGARHPSGLRWRDGTCPLPREGVEEEVPGGLVAAGGGAEVVDPDAFLPLEKGHLAGLLRQEAQEEVGGEGDEVEGLRVHPADLPVQLHDPLHSRRRERWPHNSWASPFPFLLLSRRRLRFPLFHPLSSFCWWGLLQIPSPFLVLLFVFSSGHRFLCFLVWVALARLHR